MNKKERLVPELRFPKFEGDDRWVQKKLGEIGEPLMCKRIFKEQTTSNSHNNIPFYKIGTFGRIPDAYISKKLFEEFKSKYNFPEKGDILISASGTIGRLVIYDGEPAYFQDSNIVWLGHDEKQVRNDFLFYCYSILKWQTSDGGVIKRLYNSDLKNISISFPEEPKEQQKIAQCLSSIDELIQTHTDKLEALQDHKKGLLQNLFPQEGQKVPKYRFAEFEKVGNWKTSPFSKVFTFLVTNSFSRAKLNYESGIVKNIHYGDIHTKFQTLFDVSKEEVPYINEDIPLSRIKKENYCKVGDMIFADASEDLDDVGKSIEIVKLNSEKLLSGLHTLQARQIDNDLEIGFGGYLFKSPQIRKQIKREAQGAKVLGISGTRLSNIKLTYPENKKEQQKITSCLTAIDDLITVQTQKIAQLQNHKKGLMQKLFPKVKS